MSGLVVVGAVLSLFGYQLFMGNDGLGESFALIGGSWYFGAAYFFILLFTFVCGLVTFPYYWWQGIRGYYFFFVKRNKPNWGVVKSYFIGLLFSALCIVTAVGLGTHLGNLNAT